MIRKIHLDFHTRPSTLDVGSAFDAVEFADTLARAHVNYLATPGKCQYGETYYETELGHTHPHLVRPDLFPQTVEACVGRGIAVQAYFTLGLDDVAAAKHPEWRQRYRDGSYAQWGAKHICFASPYADEVVIPEALEMLERCPGLSGFWFDICLYCDGAFYSESFERAAQERLGEAAQDEHARWLLGRQLIRECCERIDKAIREKLPDAENYFNSLVVPGEAENIPLQPIQEVENPFQFGGPEVMTAHARWLRPHGSPVIGLVSRFQGPWMDPGTLRTPDQLRFDVGRTLALGCHVSMGDHRHPDGTLDKEVYRRLGPIFHDIAVSDRWLDSTVPCREVVLVSEVEQGTPHIIPVLPAATLAAARLLEEIDVQFDIVTTGEELPPARLVISVGETVPDVPEGTALLLIAGGESGSTRISDAAGHVAQSETTFFRCHPSLGVGPFNHAVTLPVQPIELSDLKTSGEVLAKQMALSSHNPPTTSHHALGPVIVQAGQTIHCAIPLFNEQAESGSAFLRDVLRALCERLLGSPLVRHDGGTSVAAHLHRARHGYNLHLVHWAMDRSAQKPNPVAQFPPLGPINIEIAVEETVIEVTSLPDKQPISFEQVDGVVRFTVPSMHVWKLIALDV